MADEPRDRTSRILTMAGRQRRRFVKQAALGVAGTTLAASMRESLIGSAFAQGPLSWPTHSNTGYLSVAPGVGSWGLDTPAGSGRHPGQPDPAIFFVNTTSNDGSLGALAPEFGPNVYTGSFEFAVRHGASPKKIYICVSGYIDCGRRVPLQTGAPPRPGYVSILGQTAPQPGAFIKGTHLQLNGASNVHVSHLRLYMGDEPYSGSNYNGVADNRDCLSSGYSGGSSDYLVFENCEFAFGLDELVDLYYTHGLVSFFQCAFVDPLHVSIIPHSNYPPGTDHGFGLIIGGGSQPQPDRIAIFRCLFAHTTQRTPLTTCQRTAMANNVFYNCKNEAIGLRNGSSANPNPQPLYLNALYNLFMRGPDNSNNLPAVRAHSNLHADSRVYLQGNAASGWTAPTQNAFVSGGPSGFISDSLIANSIPNSWGGLPGLLAWVANPASPTNLETHAIIDLIGRTVGAQPRLPNRKGRMPIVLQQMHDSVECGSTQSQHLDTVAQAGGWEDLGCSIAVNPLDPGHHWHAPFPMGADRNVPYTSGTFSDGKSKVGYTRLDEFDYEQKLLVMR